MRVWYYYWLILPCLIITTSSTTAGLAAAAKPNIVILLADNLGYEDVSWFANNNNEKNRLPYRTPHIDSIGLTGKTFLNYNSVAHLCSASRAALLTGLYPARTGIYPGVFHPDAALGMSNHTVETIAGFLKKEGYATSIVGKWHLGHAKKEFLPISHGFDEWLGIPYHMSGGSIDNHTCVFDTHQYQYLPLYQDDWIVQQPVRTNELARTYAQRATDFVHRNIQTDTPFFLYMAFSHVHQLCASANQPEQTTCQWANAQNAASDRATFADAVVEMDWIVGEILRSLDEVINNTLVVFTSDNGPWVAEQACAGLKGPFEGQWLREHVPWNCTACPHDYVPSPTRDRLRRCILQTNTNSKQHQEVDGIHCGEDTGLGSVWEANLRMPTLMKWPGQIAFGTKTAALVSSLDLFPTIRSIVARNNPSSTEHVHQETDGVDISPVLFGNEKDYDSNNRVLFFWRDGFKQNMSPLGPPYGRFDIVAVKVGHIKAWFWTKSAHYNNDIEEYHEPPLLFDTITDPAEAYPIQYSYPNVTSPYRKLVDRIYRLVKEHQRSIGDKVYPLTISRDSRFIPCVDPSLRCRTVDEFHGVTLSD